MASPLPQDDFSFPIHRDQQPAGHSWFDQQQPGNVGGRLAWPNSRSVVVDEQVDYSRPPVLVDERVRREWELANVARPIDVVEKVYERPTVRHVRTLVPKVSIREVTRQIDKEDSLYDERPIPIAHEKIVDRYVEVPIPAGEEIKYVPRIEVRERVIETDKPMIQWRDKVVDLPIIKEVVKYVESDSNVEQITRYLPKSTTGANAEAAVSGSGPNGSAAAVDSSTPDFTSNKYGSRPVDELVREIASMEAAATGSPPVAAGYAISTAPSAPTIGPFDARQEAAAALMDEDAPLPDVTSEFVYGSSAAGGAAAAAATGTIAAVEKTIVEVPVPFVVPRPVKYEVDVPLVKFVDHFVPVPVARHVIPVVRFTDEEYVVECVHERPVLVVEQQRKPVPVDVPVRLRESNVKVTPVDPATLSQADQHAAWTRVNNQLLETLSEEAIANNPELARALLRAENGDDDADAVQGDELDGSNNDQVRSSEEVIEDMTTLPLHPGHPYMAAVLQNEWMHTPTLETHKLYGSEFLRTHLGALNSIRDPQYHQVNVANQQIPVVGSLDMLFDFSESRFQQKVVSQPTREPRHVSSFAPAAESVSTLVEEVEAAEAMQEGCLSAQGAASGVSDGGVLPPRRSYDYGSEDELFLLKNPSCLSALQAARGETQCCGVGLNRAGGCCCRSDPC